MNNNTPKIQIGEAFVCYFDILGTKHRFHDSEPSFNRLGPDANVVDEIRRMHRVQCSIEGWIEMLGDARRDESGERRSYVFLFSDCGYLAFLVGHPFDDECKFGKILRLMSICQTELLLQRFVIRGGVSFGLCGFSSQFIAGPGAIQAAAGDHHGGPPFLAVDKTAFKEVINRFAAARSCKLSSNDNVFLQPWWKDRFVLDKSTETIYLNYMSDWVGCESDYPREDLFLAQRSFVMEEGCKTADAFEKFSAIGMLHNYTLFRQFPLLSESDRLALSIPTEFFGQDNCRKRHQFDSPKRIFETFFGESLEENKSIAP